MDQHSYKTVAALRSRANVFLLAAGLAQIAAAFTPAGRGRLVGVIPFIRLPNAGVAFVVLGILTALVALWRRGWWRWIPGIVSAALLTVVYMRLRWDPSGTFADPVVRRIVRPSWGFYPMGVAIFLSLAAPIRVGRRSRPAPAKPAPERLAAEPAAVSLPEPAPETRSAQPAPEGLRAN